MLGAAKVGAITAGINPSLAPPEQARLVELGRRPVWSVTGDDVDALPVSGEAPPSPLPDDPDRPVAIVFTSGTTGTPKGAVFTNRPAVGHHLDRRR